MRSIRHVREIRDARMAQDAAGAPVRRKPSDDFHDDVWRPLCDRVATAAAARLGRPLTADECRAIWRARSPLILEVAAREIEAGAAPGDVERLLSSLPTGLDRPDPTDWCRRWPGRPSTSSS
jgi:hypothetical protein